MQVLRGDDLAPIGRIELGEDIDNVGVDATRHRVLVGHGNSALAVIDPATRIRTGEIGLRGRPEGFQIDETGTRVFVNLPNAREMEVANLAAEANQSLPTQGAELNFPRQSITTHIGFSSPFAVSRLDGAFKPGRTCGGHGRNLR